MQIESRYSSLSRMIEMSMKALALRQKTRNMAKAIKDVKTAKAKVEKKKRKKAAKSVKGVT